MSLSLEFSKQTKKIPPGPRGLPLVGSLPLLGKQLHITLNQLSKQYGSVFQLRAGRRTVVALNGLEAIKEALVKQQEAFNSRADFDLFQKPAEGGLLETKNGEPWRKHREIASQVMHTFVVSKSALIQNHVMEEAADLANIFLNYGCQPFDPDLYMPLATLGIMHRVMFGSKCNPENPEFAATAHILKRFPHATLNRVKLEFMPKIVLPFFVLSHLKSFSDFYKVIATVHKYVAKNVEQHRDSFDSENIRDMADALLKATNELTNSDRDDLGLSENDIVRGTLVQFTGAGTEPACLQLTWALLYMIAYPDIQSKIQQELDEVVGREQQPCLAHRAHLPFTEACVNEIYRHSSAGPIPLTYTTITDTILGGYFIAKNTPLFINYYSLTRDERYWEEPEKFNPYRFLDENGKLKKDLLDKFYPFGIGARRCLGEYLGRLEIFIFFTNLLHKCKFEKVSKERLTFEPKSGIFIRPQKYKVIVKPRF
ncbi:MAG: cytochrome P450 [Nostoc indistinguendum CM1-VF10]|jgi:cytochrome P450|nr:cytochrome P450 [Nostoc indistinguendum CM1-VF10]